MDALRKFSIILLLILVVICLFPGYGSAKTSLHEDMANTAEEEWERVRHNTAITSAKSIGQPVLSAGPIELFGLPHRTITFPVSGADDPVCQVTKCSAWDWSNHTHSTNIQKSDFTALAPYSAPGFVKNMSYIPNFVCYDGNWLQWGGATTSAFQDPIPAGNVVVQVRVCPLFRSVINGFIF
jgi:hypothetical protein